jgi:hypothetical protein
MALNITLNELVFDLIELYRANYKNTDSLSEEQVRNWIHATRAAILKSRLDNNPFYIDESWVQSLVHVSVGNSATVAGKTYIRSLYQLPLTLNRRGGEATFTLVSSGDHGVEPYNFVSYDRAQYAGNGVFNTVTKYAFLNNGYMYVKNETITGLSTWVPVQGQGSVPYINVKGIFFNPELAATFGGYLDFENSYDYPIDQSIIVDMQNIIKKSNFNFILQQLEDKKADGSDSINKDK